MKREFKFVALAFAAMSVMVSCEKKGGNGGDGGDGGDGNNELVGEITKDLTLKSGESYTLNGSFHVKNGATLTIEPGVTIIAKDDKVVDYILIEQGARIDAQGTADKPIIMTSEKKEHGAWGGLHICGKAPINVPGKTGKSEIGDAVYGGDDAADNSGVLKYIRIEYAGYPFSEEKEANGFTFYGVGNGTVCEYLQAYKGSDDGFEWFGGTVNVKYLISTDNTDDLFDWTEGWTGKAQFLVGVQEVAECDCLMEADNHSDNPALTPVSHPVISNVTLVGNGSEDNKRGVRLRAGTQVELYNAIVIGKPQCLTVETEETENALKDGVSKLQNILLEKDMNSKEGIYTSNMFVEAGNKVQQKISLSDVFKGIIDGGVSVSDIFFTSASYAGAVDPENDWTKGWSL